MASRIGPRTVKDATRFTSTIPHATSKAGAAAAAASPSPAASASAAAAAKQSSRIPGETPEQRVRRLRQAHLAAQRAQVSQTDKVIDASRRFFDAAHRWTVTGLVLFTVIAGIVSIYSVWDMLRYNRARRTEWLEAQKKLEADTLASARLAFLKGQATEEQIALVEEANRDATERGVKLPPLISPPEHRTHFEERVKPAFTSGGDASGATEGSGKGILGMVSGLFGGKTTTASTTVDVDPVTNSSAAAGNVVQTVESGASYVQEKARNTWEAEMENQRRGGELDQLGLAATGSGTQSSKKGWWPW